MSEEGIDSMSDELMVGMFFVSNEVGEVAFSSEEGSDSKPLSEDHENETRVDEGMMVLRYVK